MVLHPCWVAVVSSNSAVPSSSRRGLCLQSVYSLSLPAGSFAANNTVSSVNNEMFPTTTKTGQRRRKLYKMGTLSQLLDSPLAVRKFNMSTDIMCWHLACQIIYIFFQSSAGAEEEKESDHVIIKRQLRSKTCRKWLQHWPEWAVRAAFLFFTLKFVGTFLIKTCIFKINFCNFPF